MAENAKFWHREGEVCLAVNVEWKDSVELCASL